MSPVASPVARGLGGGGIPPGGAGFAVLAADGGSFSVGLAVLNSGGSSFTVSSTVLDSDGNGFSPI
jgi:hypothetical protein